MSFGEDKNKVNNIVLPQVEKFRKVYKPIIDELKDQVYVDYSRGFVEQDLSPSTKLYHLSMLPKYLQLELKKDWNKIGHLKDLEDVLRVAANDPDTADSVRKGLSNIVRMSSISQSVKTILTAGIVKSVKYSSSKLNKMWKSQRS